MKSKLSQAVKERLKKKFCVRSFKQSDLDFWIACWDDYDDDDATRPSKNILLRSWHILLSDNPTMLGFMLEDKATQKPIGFLHAIPHPSTWHDKDVCYVEDAYIIPEYRNSSGFLVLYNEFINTAKNMGYERVYWITRETNHRARRLYTRISEETNWIRYELELTSTE